MKNNTDLAYMLIGMKLASVLFDDKDNGIDFYYAKNKKDCPYCNGEKDE